MARKPTDIDEYLATLTPAQRSVIAKLREVIGAAAPRAQEHLGYGMPGFRLDGRPLLSFAAWKNHYSLYASTAAVRRAVPEVVSYEAEKATIQFPASEPVPYGLVKKIVKARVAEVEAKAKAKPRKRS